jgi:hypothetical protein
MGLPAEEIDANQSLHEFVVNMKERAEQSYEIARIHLKTAAERRKTTYDIRVKETKFKVGDWVWYWYPRKYQARSPKWQKCYTGPYLVVRVIEPVNFVLQKTPRAKPFVIHADKLKKCYSSTPPSWIKTETDAIAQVPVAADQHAPSNIPMHAEGAASQPAGGSDIRGSSKNINYDAGPHALRRPRHRTANEPPSQPEGGDLYITANYNVEAEVLRKTPHRQRQLPRRLKDFMC